MTKEWRGLPDYEGFYEISDSGDIRRIRTHCGRSTCRQLKPCTKRGYLQFGVTLNNETRWIIAHRAVWKAFVGPIPPKMQINHKNGSKTDNRLDNLEVCTPSENMKHAYNVLCRDPKRPQMGARNGRSKLCEEDIREIRRLRDSGLSQQELANLFGINQTGISGILRGITWSHVTN